MLRKSFIIISFILNLIRKKWWFIRKIFSELFVCFKKSRTFAPVKHRGVEQLVARWAHNPKVIRSSRISATKEKEESQKCGSSFLWRLFFTDFIRFYSSLPNERYSNGVSPVRFLKNEKKYSVDWKPKKKEISFTDWEVPTLSLIHIWRCRRAI